jgi:hypothetical protein
VAECKKSEKKVSRGRLLRYQISSAFVDEPREPTVPQEPNEVVADEIIKEAVDSKIIEETFKPKLRDLLLSGTTTPADWRLLIESSDSKKETSPKSQKRRS